jgi:uncharacterized membrane protein
VLQYLFARGREAMDSVYEGRFDAATPSSGDAPARQTGRLIARRGTSGAFLAFAVRDLVALATKTDCTIELIPQVGDFVSIDDPLARIHPPNAKISEATINALVASDRSGRWSRIPCSPSASWSTLASAPCRPRSTTRRRQSSRSTRSTACCAMPGSRTSTRAGSTTAAGTLRLIFPTPAWDDIVGLALTELRHYGANSIQVARRTKAMLEHLITALPQARAGALRRELAALENSVARSFVEEDDRRRANLADFQGLGGSSSRRDET